MQSIFAAARGALAVMTLSLVNVACGEADYAGGDAEPGAAQSAIRGGTLVTNFPTAVSLHTLGCTGVLVAHDTIVTAAHCVNKLVPSSGGFLSINAWVMKNSQQVCITCATPSNDGSQRRVRVAWDPAFRGLDTEPDAPSDFAVLVLAQSEGSAFNNTAGVQFAAIYADALGHTRNMTVFGRGLINFAGDTDHRMRSGRKFMDGWSADRLYFFADGADGDAQQMCRGDSGGPAMGDGAALTTAVPMLLGVMSNSDKSSSKTCAIGRERWTRASTKVWLIDQALQAERSRRCLRLRQRGRIKTSPMFTSSAGKSSFLKLRAAHLG